MDFKIIILAVLSFIAGITFLSIGFYFIGEKFLNLLNEALPQKTEEALKKNTKRAKSSGYIAMGLGGLTIVWGVLMLIFPDSAAILGLTYIIILAIGLGALMIAFK